MHAILAFINVVPFPVTVSIVVVAFVAAGVA